MVKILNDDNSISSLMPRDTDGKSLPPSVNLGMKSVPDDSRPAKYFSWNEWRCQETKLYPQITDHFLHFNLYLDALRRDWGRPIVMVSMFRAPGHSIEKNKSQPGAHSRAVACDIRVADGGELIDLVGLSIEVAKDLAYYDWFGLGLQQKSGQRKLHIDLCGSRSNSPRPWIWTY